MENNVPILGMDPSLRNWGVVRANVDVSTGLLNIDYMALIQTSNDKSKKKTVRQSSQDLDRAKQLVSGLQKFISNEAYAFVEVPHGSGGSKGKPSHRSSVSRGIVLGVLAGLDIPIIELDYNQVKEAGSGPNATKSEMIDWATNKHPDASWRINKTTGSYQNDNEHLADALAAAYAGLSTPEFKLLQNTLEIYNGTYRNGGS